MRTLAAVLISTIMAIVLVGAPARALSDGYYSVPYSPTLYYHWHTAGLTYPAPFDQWRGDGFPAPGQAPTDFVSYPWSPQIYAVTYFEEEDWLWEHLDGEEWRRAGSPVPRDAGWIEGTTLHSYPTSEELFAELGGEVHKLTFDQWAAMDFRPPEVRNGGYLRLRWDDQVVKQSDYADTIFYEVSAQEWAAAGYPTPEARPMLPGDRVCRVGSGPELRYEGHTYTGPLSYRQWAAAGFPEPSC